jgi:hypothetical protein
VHLHPQDVNASPSLYRNLQMISESWTRDIQGVLSDQNFATFQAIVVAAIITALLPTFRSLLIDLYERIIGPFPPGPKCPTSPSLYRYHLCRVFKIPQADVIDLTGYVDRSEFIAAGGSGEIWKGAWKGINGSTLRNPQMLPNVVVKMIRVLPVKDGEKDKRFVVSIPGILDGSRSLKKYYRFSEDEA